MTTTAEPRVIEGYEEYDDGDWIIDRQEGVLHVTLYRPQSLNATSYRSHSKLAALWPKVQNDPLTRVVLVTGYGRAFCAGADLKEARDRELSHAEMLDLMREASAMVMGMVNLDKPIVSAINGPAVGSGAALALVADISIAADDAKIFDGHTTVGAVSGDHSVLNWPLLCGMAKAKYYLLPQRTTYRQGGRGDRAGQHVGAGRPTHRQSDRDRPQAGKDVTGGDPGDEAGAEPLVPGGTARFRAFDRHADRGLLRRRHQGRGAQRSPTSGSPPGLALRTSAARHGHRRRACARSIVSRLERGRWR